MIRGIGTTGHSQWNILKFQVRILALYLYITALAAWTGDALTSAENRAHLDAFLLTWLGSLEKEG